MQNCPRAGVVKGAKGEKGVVLIVYVTAFADVPHVCSYYDVCSSVQRVCSKNKRIANAKLETRTHL